MNQPRKRRRKKIPGWSLLLLGLLIAGGVAYFFFQGGGEEEVVETFVVRRGQVQERAEAMGKIAAHVQVDVSSRASGEVKEILVEPGDEVEVGQVLFRLDARDAERALLDAQVALRRASADVRQARANVDVASAQQQDADAANAISATSLERGLISGEVARTSATNAAVAGATLSQRLAAVSGSQASLAAARLAVQDAEQRVAEMDVVAPIAGTVLDIAVEVGSIVASAISNISGGTPMATLADLSDLRVLGQIDEAQIGQVSVGDAVEIRVEAYPDQIFHGRVQRVAAMGVEEVNIVTFEVEIIIEDEHASLLRSGMSADLSIITGSQEGVLVPLAAVRTEGRDRIVTMANGETRVIQSDATDGQNLVVLEGLEEGEEVRATPLSASDAPEASKSLMPGRRRR